MKLTTLLTSKCSTFKKGYFGWGFLVRIHQGWTTVGLRGRERVCKVLKVCCSESASKVQAGLIVML